MNLQVPLSTGSVEFSSIWQVLSSGLLKVILPLSALEGESYRLDNILHMKQLDLIDTNLMIQKNVKIGHLVTSGLLESVGVEMVKVVSSVLDSVKGPSTLHPLIVSFRV